MNCQAPVPSPAGDVREYEVRTTFVMCVRCRTAEDGDRDVRERVQAMATAGRAHVREVETKLVAGEPFLRPQFADDDPMLPATGVVEERAGMRLVALIAALVIGSAIAACWGLTR